MPASEVRTFAEGTLWAVQASGSGRAFATAATPGSALIGYVQEGMSWTSGRTINTIAERGIPNHHKFGSEAPIEVTFTFLNVNGFTGFLTASGATVPMVHLEHRASAAEFHGSSGIYHQFHGCVLTNDATNEQGAGNTKALTFRALAMNGPTASGYIK